MIFRIIAPVKAVVDLIPEKATAGHHASGVLPTGADGLTVSFGVKFKLNM
jgi:hypothetical protein